MSEIGHCQKTYVLVSDLGARIESLRILGIQTPDASDPIFREIAQRLSCMIGGALEGVKVQIIDMSVLAGNILACALHQQSKLREVLHWR